VVVPCYNYGRFLPDSVGSALAQHEVEPEVIVVDDASTDDSAEVAGRYAAQDPRVRLIRHAKNTGHVVAFNDGLAEATGEFIVRLDADDLLTPGALARAVALFDNHPGVGLVYGHPRHFTTPTPPAPRGGIHGWSLWSGRDWIAQRCRTGVNCITTPEAMIRGSVMAAIGGLSTRLRFAQDMEIWLRAAAVSDVGRIDGPDQALHRDHPTSMSVTDGASYLTDLVERRTVFDVLFDGPGGQLAGAGELRELARRTLATEAVVSVYHAYDRGQVGTSDVDGRLAFALETYPRAEELPAWRALRRRQRVGDRLAPVVPTFAASVVWRRLQWQSRQRRWQRTGV
jgi:cellulose synthase/poly-beta-1,6-N-acetylglucosamine synthase-like glycosyltransferase